MKKLLNAILIVLISATFCFGGSVTKGLIGKEDINSWNGVDSSFTRSTSAGYTLTLHPIDWPGIDILKVYGGGVNKTLATFTAAKAAVGTSNNVRFFLSPGTWTITDDLTITSNIELYCSSGTILNISSGKTLTINGPLVAGAYQIFSGSGSVSFGSYIREAYAEWFGSIDGTNDETQIEAAAGAFDTNTGIIKLLTKQYVIDSTLNLPTRIMLEGTYTTYATNGTYFTSNVAAAACVQIGDGSTSASGAGLKNIKIVAGTGTDGIGIYIYYGSRNLLENVYVSGFTTGTGIKIEGDSGGTAASIQNIVRDAYLANNLINLHLDGHDANDDSSADEGLFTNVRINLSTLANSKGIYLEKAFRNTFIRTSIIDSSKTSGTVGVYFDDGARSNVYSARGNDFYGTDIELITTAIHTEANCYANIFYTLHAHNPTTLHNDLSGGATIIKNYSGGLNLPTITMGTDNRTYSNLLYNGEMERWENSTSAAPTGWTLSGAGASVARDSSNERKGTYSAGVTRAGANTILYQSLSDYTYLQGRWVTAACWVKTSTASSVYIRVYDGVGGTSSNYHSGGGSYELLVVRHQVDSSATSVSIYLEIDTTNQTAYFDQAILTEGWESSLPQDSPIYDSKRLYNTVTWDPGNLADGEGETKSLTVNGAALGDFVLVSAPYDLQDTTVTGYVQATDTVEIRLQNESTGARDLDSGTWAVMVFKY